ncbi:MAG TPA: hypothetical protein VK816_03980 [Jatrophihabitantaceae bacterium]|nr:hypothetical protein [Jatrophihabitantaceae bacterium]
MITQESHSSIVDPRHLVLTAGETMARYRWGRTEGYEVMRTRAGYWPACPGQSLRSDLERQWDDSSSAKHC